MEDTTGRPTLEVVPPPRCADCSHAFPYLHKHHIIARAEGGSNDPANLVLLCPNCHTLRHRASGVAARRRKGQPQKKAASPTYGTSSVRVVKTVAFSPSEWTAIDALMGKAGTRQFTSLVRLALKDAAIKNRVYWPEDQKPEKVAV